MHLRLSTILAITAAGLICTPAALAAPDRKGDLGSGKVEVTWDGGPVTGIPVADFEVDDTQLTITEAGKLTVTLSDADDGANDIDLQLFKSNAAGEPVGAAIAESAEGGSDERLSKDVTPGQYLVRVIGFLSIQGHFKGKAALAVSGATPSTAVSTPPVVADLLPEAKLGKLPKAKAKKSLTLKGTASDDKGVKAVEVAIVKTGKKCTQLGSNGKFTPAPKCDGPTSFLKAKGTTSWSLKIAKGLPKGSYMVFARATDTGGQKQGGYSKANKKALNVK